MISTFNIENNIIDDEKENLGNFILAIQSENFKSYNLSMFSKIGKPINQVVISTWFAAKGLEFDAIILLGMDEGMMTDYIPIVSHIKPHSVHFSLFISCFHKTINLSVRIFSAAIYFLLVL